MSTLNHFRQFNVQCSLTGRTATVRAFSAAHALREAKSMERMYWPVVWPLCYNKDSWFEYLRALKQAENVAFHAQKKMLDQMAAAEEKLQ